MFAVKVNKIKYNKMYKKKNLQVKKYMCVCYSTQCERKYKNIHK